MKRKIICIIIWILFIGFLILPNINGTKIIQSSIYDEQLDQEQTLTENKMESAMPFGFLPDDDILILAQSFKPSLVTLSKVDILLRKLASQEKVTLLIKDDLNSVKSLVTIQLDYNEINHYPSWTTFNFDDIDVIIDNTYYIVLSTNASALLLIYNWHYSLINSELVDYYNRGIMHLYAENVWHEMDADFCFRTYGYNTDDDLKIESISGGFRVNVKISNEGFDDLIELPWSINIKDGIILRGRSESGVISELSAGESYSIRHRVYGFGSISITVTSENSTKKVSAFVLGNLVLRVQ